MNESEKPLVLSIDDDVDFLNLIKRLLTNDGYRVTIANSGREGLDLIRKEKPNLILLDIKMKEMDGYEICSQLQADRDTSSIPVIFATVLGEDHNRARAFSMGAVDYLVKPVQKETLLEKVKTHIRTDLKWKALKSDTVTWHERIQPGGFIKFKESVFSQLNLTPEQKYKYAHTPPLKIYTITSDIAIRNSKMAQYIAAFLDLPYAASINPDNVLIGVLPTPFCRAKHVCVVSDASAERAFVLANPFDLDCLEDLRKVAGLGKTSKIIISEPENIDLLLRHDISGQGEDLKPKEMEMPVIEDTKEISESEIEKNPAVYVANVILDKAVSENASDIHILPKETQTTVRFRIDGDLKEYYSLKKPIATQLIARFMVLSDLDIAEKRKPQDGGFAAMVGNKTFNFRTSLSSTPYGESLNIRLLEPYASPKELTELGMTGRQADALINLLKRNEGLILVVGPTGSGKTTTIYSMLHKIDYEKNSLVSVEDPIEYRIPFVNQQQVNEKLGVTFEALLRSAVRQDPDILFMGEIRDPYTAKMSLDFSSTGHLTISSLHTSNATTAVFRLERLGIDRRALADTILAVVAQRLLKKLCPQCKKILPISQEEREMLSPFTDDIPSQVAHPEGCPQCNDTGYRGREGVFEVLEIDARISEMIRTGVSIAEIRAFARNRGDFLKSSHAIEKVRKFTFPPKDVYEKVLLEDIKLERTDPGKTAHEDQPPETEAKGPPSILVAEDDEDTRVLIGHILRTRGYRVALASDGIDALLCLGSDEFDLILSDVNMPNLDGFHLLEIMNQKEIQTPVIFLTARDSLEDERKGFELGAMDYIRKPIDKEILSRRVTNAIDRRRQ